MGLFARPDLSDPEYLLKTSRKAMKRGIKLYRHYTDYIVGLGGSEQRALHDEVRGQSFMALGRRMLRDGVARGASEEDAIRAMAGVIDAEAVRAILADEPEDDPQSQPT